MRLTERFRPARLADIVGQPPISYLQQLVASPRPCCILLEGPPGCGKTTAALALANDLNVHDFDLHLVIGSEFSVDEARRLWSGPLTYMPRNAGGWKLLLIEELEYLSPQCQVFCKTALECRLPGSTIVVATSNGVGKLSKALVQRFKTYIFSGGPTFAQASVERLQRIWQTEAPGVPMPRSLPEWGWDGDQYSMRLALSEMEDHLGTLGVLHA